jgi:transcriptional regulator with XRE-family HTH domain
METPQTMRPSYLVIIASNMFRLRKERGLSQEKLAQRADISGATVHVLEKAKNPDQAENWPRLDTLIAIADALDVELARLVEWDPEAMRAYLNGQRPRSLQLVAVS